VSSLVERLRGVVRPAAQTGGAEAPQLQGGTDVPRLRFNHDQAAEALGGEWREDSGQRFLVVDRRYAPGHRHGHVAVCDSAPGDAASARLHLLAGSGASALDRLLFIDLETTGLAGGAGTYAFLVGCGWWDGSCFRVRQFFLSAFGAERVLLDAVTELAGTAGAVVTYNGKTFDLPLIETRYLLHRMTTPFAGMPHVDMLHPARRLWRSDEQEGCRLMELETTLLGHEREGDVPGFEIPARYFNFVRSGDARPLEPVLEHNRLDLLSLALVTARAVQLLDEGPAAARTAREAFGMGRLYERGHLMSEASACYWRGAELPGDATAQAENLRGYAVLARRQRRFAEAADAWRRVLTMRRCPPPIVREATEALAVHHEHRARDLEAARQFALQALPLQGSASRREAVQHRLARLNRKLGTGPTEALF
jgi:uncharacterized protein YprB with RNaseH-like and TPR domain